MPANPDIALEVYLLGQLEFLDAQRFQRRLVYDVGEYPAVALVLCEHPPTISVGRQGSRLHIVPDDDSLRALGIRTHWVNRGGGCVLHLPGQLAGYVVAPLQALELDLAAYLHRIHLALIGLLAAFDLQAHPRPDLEGLFLGGSRVATVGVAVNRWIAYHGFTLNVGTYLPAFDLLDEAGFNAQRLRQTSMESRRQRPAPMSRVKERLIEQIQSAFSLDQLYLYTDHPSLRRKSSRHVHAAGLG